MLSHVAVSLVALVVAPALAQTQTPLAALRFTYPDVPYMVDTNDGPRGIQTGINRCNSTTENQESLCQTSWVNSIDDFCLWAPQEPSSVVGDTEGEMVAWCTKPGHGTRLIPPGALKGVQWLRMPNYIQITGFVDQTLINIEAADYGGEMDPHGADLRGNPLGGIVFSSAFNPHTGSSNINGQTINQVIEWTNFMGSNVFCLKACDPAWGGGPRQCEHIYDRIGCAYNAPSSNPIGTFEECEADNNINPGLYVVNGVTSTYRQPPESLGPISTIPYIAQLPASSACTTYSSNALYQVGGVTRTTIERPLATSESSFATSETPLATSESSLASSEATETSSLPQSSSVVPSTASESAGAATPTGSSGAAATDTVVRTGGASVSGSGSATTGSRTAPGGSAASAGATSSTSAASRVQLSASAALALISFLLVAQ